MLSVQEGRNLQPRRCLPLCPCSGWTPAKQQWRRKEGKWGRPKPFTELSLVFVENGELWWKFAEEQFREVDFFVGIAQ